MMLISCHRNPLSSKARRKSVQTQAMLIYK